MKKNNITTTIGTINLNDICFVEDSLDIFIGIESVSSEIQDKINKAVEIASSEYPWNSKELETQMSLWAKIKNKAMTYCISVDIINPADGNFMTVTNIDIDLSEYQSELKKVIVKAMIDNFLVV